MAASKFKRGDIVRLRSRHDRELHQFDRIDETMAWAQLYTLGRPLPDGPTDDSACRPEELVRPSVAELREVLASTAAKRDELAHACKVIEAEITRRAR